MPSVNARQYTTYLADCSDLFYLPYCITEKQEMPENIAAFEKIPEK